MSIRKALSPRIDGQHHAYLVLGGEPWSAEALYSFPILGINEARELRERAQLASAGEDLIVSCGAITEEAQNALLKTLEEPARGLTFIILSPRSIQLLPTLLSRLEVIKIGEVAEDLAEVKKFVAANPETRLKLVANFPKNVALKFLNQLENYLAQNLKSETASAEIVFALEQITQGRVYLEDKSGTAKLILEQIALILPTLDNQTP